MAVSGQKWGVALKDLSKERISSARSNMVEGKVEAVNNEQPTYAPTLKQ